MSTQEIHVHPSLEALSLAAADAAAALLQATPPRGRFNLVLSGGNTPALFHELLATRYAAAIPWECVHVFWGDERFVPADHPASNYRMARETFIRHLPLPSSHVHRIPTEPPTLEASAEAFEASLRRFFGAAEPVFDLVVLGLGDDGHTASLFPGSPALEERTRWVAPVEAPAYMSPRERITMTFPLLDRSRHTFFLVAGEGKRPPLRAILDGSEEARQYPAARVTARETLRWFVDEAAYGT